MHTKHETRNTLISFLLTLFAVTSYYNPTFAQVNQCGTEDLPLSFYQELRAQAAGQPASLGPLPTIPIWLYLLRGNNGETNHSIQEFEGYMSALNNYFSDVAKFTICGSSVIDNENYRDLHLPVDYADLDAYVHNTINQPNSDHCVRVYICDILHVGGMEEGGSTYRPGFSSMPAIFVKNNSKQTFAHEMGHYFLLDHTHQGGITHQYVNSPVLILGQNLTCHQTGDGVCDTRQILGRHTVRNFPAVPLLIAATTMTLWVKNTTLIPGFS